MSFEKLKPGCGDLDPEIGYFDGELDIEIEFPEEGESAHLVSEKLECEEGGIQKEEISRKQDVIVICARSSSTYKLYGPIPLPNHIA